MDSVTGQEVEFHLGLWNPRQDGQAVVWVAVVMLLIVALLVAGAGIAQLMIFRWDAQGAADAAALAGANIQSQGIMSLSFLEALVTARRGLLNVLYVALGVFTGLCILGNPAACSAVPQLLYWIHEYDSLTYPIEELIVNWLQPFIRVVFPFYASANATWFGWKNGALAVGVPLPLIKLGEDIEPPSNGEADGKFQGLSEQTEAISTCMQWLADPLNRIVSDSTVAAWVESLEDARDSGKLERMRDHLLDLDASSLRPMLQRLIAATEQAMQGYGGCDMRGLDRMINDGLACGAEVTCDSETQKLCEDLGVERGGRAGFQSTLEHIHDGSAPDCADALLAALDDVQDCLADKNNELCTRELAGQITDYYSQLIDRVNAIKKLVDDRQEALDKCLRCMLDASTEDAMCRHEEIEEGGKGLTGLQGTFVIVWRKAPRSKSPLDLDSRLWHSGTSVGAVYASAFASAARVVDSDGKCRRCLFQSVSLGPLQSSLLGVLVDVLVLLFDALLGSDDCPRPPGWPEGGVKGIIAKIVHLLASILGDAIAWINGLFGYPPPDLCERRPVLTRVDAGLTVHLGLTGPRDRLNQFVGELIAQYNELADTWNGVPETVDKWAVWDLFPEAIRELLADLRLERITAPDLTGGLF